MSPRTAYGVRIKHDTPNESYAQDAFQNAMYLRLEKINAAWNRWRWYVLSVQPTLFGDWAFRREWGRIGEQGGQAMTAFYASEGEALKACRLHQDRRCRRGYVSLPEQLDLPF